MLDLRLCKRPLHTGLTNMRWPNSFFDRAGLFSMEAAKRESSILLQENH